SPMGAFASFTLGFPGVSGGLGMEIGKPANQSVYIGLETDEKGIFNAMPFYEGFEDQYEQFGLNQTVKRRAEVTAFDSKKINRDFKLATDRWHSGDLTFTIYNPVRSIPDPESCEPEELMRALTPAVIVELTVDNRENSRSRKAFFGFRGNDPYSNMRQLDDSSDGKLIGVGQGGRYAIATTSPSAYSGLAFNIEDILMPAHQSNVSFGIGSVGAIVLEVEPHTKKTFRFAICFFNSGVATAGLHTRYYYTQFFSSIEDVAEYTLRNFDSYLAWANEADRALDESVLSDDQRFMAAHAVRSYYGSTQLLRDKGDKPIWIVNEGEYRMMNTLDLTADQMFFEMTMNPWTVRNVLDFFLENYSYQDRVVLPGQTQEYPGGLSFTHDMGIGNVFWKHGYSSYEQFGIKGCFSHMTCEELTNWVCCGAAYYEHTRDEKWLGKNATVFEQCLRSLVNRDHFDPDKRKGIMGLDSNRTAGGSEITTYDSLDASLGQARDNLYLGVKIFAAYLALERVLGWNDRKEAAALAQVQAGRSAKTILDNVLEDGCLPAIIGENCQSRIIPVIEGLAFAYFAGCRDKLTADGPYSNLLLALRKHLENILVKGICLFEDGGWKISSTSVNSWLSKIYICQFVAREILHLPQDLQSKAADAAHVQWLLHPELSYWCWSDQIVGGKITASKYYPRGVTSILWLYEKGNLSKFRSMSESSQTGTGNMFYQRMCNVAHKAGA
ncbi:MAG TPA: glycoside hydrolase family 52 protein, partial [Methylococcales bacterium]